MASRSRLTQRSHRTLVILDRQPKWLLALIAGAVVLAGLFAPGVAGAILLLGAVAALVWLLALSWPVVQGAPRAIRLVTIALLLIAAVLKLR